jgi:hypothetical protein
MQAAQIHPQPTLTSSPKTSAFQAEKNSFLLISKMYNCATIGSCSHAGKKRF